MITIDYQDGEVQLTFPYNPTYISLIKDTTTNRRWHPEKKKWLVGLTDLQQQLLPVLEKNGIPHEFTDRYDKAFINVEKEIITDFGLKYSLYPYQIEGANAILEHDRFGLFHDCGLGKTIMCIAVMNKLSIKTPTIINPNKEKLSGIECLIVCPSSLKKQWKEEIEKFSTLTSTIVEGSKDKRKKLWDEITEIKIINYEQLRFNEEPFLKEWDVIILDESSRIKNAMSQVSRKSKQLRGKKKIVATATPIENGIKDLYSIFEFLNPMILGNWWKFKEKFLVTELKNFGGNTFEEIVGERNTEELKNIIKPYYIRRTKQEVLKDLPNLIEETIYVELTTNEKRLYNHIKSLIKDKINKIKIGMEVSIGGELQLLRVLCNGEVCLKRSNTTNLDIISKQHEMIERSGKIEEVYSLINQLLVSPEEKIIVFSDYTTPLFVLKEVLERNNIQCSMLYGGADKEKEIEEFKTQQNKKVFLCQTQTGGFGLNLTEASNVIFMNEPWNPANRHQALSRSHRMGQTKPVFVYTFITTETIEEHVHEVLSDKQEVSEKIIMKDIHKYI